MVRPLGWSAYEWTELWNGGGGSVVVFQVQPSVGCCLASVAVGAHDMASNECGCFLSK